MSWNYISLGRMLEGIHSLPEQYQRGAWGKLSDVLQISGKSAHVEESMGSSLSASSLPLGYLGATSVSEAVLEQCQQLRETIIPLHAAKS